MRVRKIMLVDDEPDIRDIAELALAEVGGWEVILAESGAAALEMVEAVQPDLIVMDVMMPGMDGPTALLRLRACPPVSDTPVIFLTASCQQREIEQLHQLGVCGVLQKPFDPMTLPEQIRRIVEPL